MRHQLDTAVMPHDWPDRSTGAAQLACDGRQIRDTEPCPPPEPEPSTTIKGPGATLVIADRVLRNLTEEQRIALVEYANRKPTGTDSWEPVLAEYGELRQGIDDLCKRLHGWSQHDNTAAPYAAHALELVEKADEIRDMLGTAVES